jgi:hypothetical protein
MSDATEKTTDFLKDLGDAARRNPVSTGLIGMGLLWLFTGGKSVGRAGDLFRRTDLDRPPDTVKDAWANVGSGLAEDAGSARDIANSTLSTVREGASSTLDQASDFAQSKREGDVFQAARENLTELFRAQPLALGAIGLAIGAGIAAALPGTDAENSYLGEVSETIKSKTAEITGQQVDKAATLATDAMDAAAEEARKQGLTIDGARAAVADVTDRASRVADAAKKAATDRVG